MGIECGEYNEVQSERYYRARKPHTCCACQETIPVGHLYSYTFTLFEGSAQGFKHCLRCDRMLDILHEKHRAADSDWTVDIELNCGHEWKDFFDGEPPPELVALAFMTPDEMQAEFGKQARK